MQWGVGVMFALAVGSAGCELPPGDILPPDQSGWVIVDAGPPPDLVHAVLDGGAGSADMGPPPKLGFLELEVDDDDTGLPMPARVIFRPVPGSGFADDILSGRPDPMSMGGAIGSQIAPGVVGSTEGVMLSGGSGIVPVPPGTYSLFITRGPEYEAAQISVGVGLGQTQVVHARLPHSVDTRGWLSADMHIHMARSYDSQIGLDRRVVNEVSNGVELLVPTDHNVITDLTATLAGLGYGGDVAGTIPGNEFNFQEGHGGAYPVTYDAMAPHGGAVAWQADCTKQPILGPNCYTAADAFPMMRLPSPLTVITVNHPFWPAGDLGYFTNIGWGSGTGSPLPSTLSTAGLFDALEVLNGYQTSEVVISHMLADWFYLLGAGHRITALGNSDTHRMNWLRGGWPRTWLKLPVDRPGDVTPAMLSTAIKKGRALASTGPFITLNVDGADIGDDVKPVVLGQVTVAITVDAPSWMQVDKVRIYVNGDIRQEIMIPSNRRPVLVGTYVETLTSDSWIVVEASGLKPLPADVVGEYGTIVGTPMKPYAITNPVFVDADSDGVFNPPPSGFRSPYRRVPHAPPGAAPPAPFECAPELMRQGAAEPSLDGPDWLWDLTRRKSTDRWMEPYTRPTP